jgi:hypothetical protein
MRTLVGWWEGVELDLCANTIINVSIYKNQIKYLTITLSTVGIAIYNK